MLSGFVVGEAVTDRYGFLFENNLQNNAKKLLKYLHNSAKRCIFVL
jgi:hypothetical protein